MKCNEVKIYLNDFADGLLPDETNKIVAAHLADCPVCREEYEELISIIEEAKLIPSEIDPPRDLWNDISLKIGAEEKNARIFQLEKDSDDKKNYKLQFEFKRLYPWRKIALAGAFTLFIASVFVFLFMTKQNQQTYLLVQRLEGSPLVGEKKINNLGRLEIGKWIETDDSSKARLKIASIGDVDIFPNSRIRLIETKPSEYRIQLEKGMIDCSIWAAPKLFFVETPSATAIDLGCRYTLEVEQNGTSFIHVIMGKVAFESGGRESIVPTGAVCETRMAAGPGTPHYPTSPENLKLALSKLDFENGDEKQVDVVVGSAGKNDALSLWHLLKKKDNRCKMKIFSKLKDMFDIPETITIQKIVQGDQETFDELWKILEIGKKKA